MTMRYFPSDFRLWDPHFTGKNDPKIYSHDGKDYYLPFEATICIRNMANWFWDDDYTKDLPQRGGSAARNSEKNLIIVPVFG